MNLALGPIIVPMPMHGGGSDLTGAEIGLILIAACAYIVWIVFILHVCRSELAVVSGVFLPIFLLGVFLILK
jgi:hypothetical protein